MMEYRYVVTWFSSDAEADDISEDFNESGGDGYRLIQLIQHNGGLLAIFERAFSRPSGKGRERKAA